MTPRASRREADSALLQKAAPVVLALLTASLVAEGTASAFLESGLGHRRRVSVSSRIDDAEVEAAMGADVGGFGLTVSPVAHGVDVDDQILAAAIGNLLQNAFKFCRPHAHIALCTTATAERVRIEIEIEDEIEIEVEDECGGLPPGKAEDLFLPFSQRSDQRGGLGLGLTISRKGVEAMGGSLGVRDVPGKGCVFVIELPRMPAA